MGSYPMKNGVHDFNPEDHNKMQDTRSFPRSGVTAGVQDGLSMVENLPRGAKQAQQENHGNNFRQESGTESVAGKNGKNFDILY